jgi:glycosyltransferase involved in cell wall biosynthesis
MSTSARPRILFLTTELPWPAVSGGAVRTLETLHALGAWADTTVAAFVEPPCNGCRGASDLAGMIRGLSILTPVPHPIRIRQRPAALARTAWQALSTGHPYLAAKFWNPAYAQAVAQTARDHPPDLVYVDHLNVATYLDVLPHGVPVILDEHNVEWRLFAEAADRELRRLRRAALRLEAQRARAYEATALGRMSRVLAPTPEDASELRALVPSARVVAVPTSAGEPESFRPEPRDGSVVLFVGTLSWPPNFESARWLVREVWPRVRRQNASVELWIAGGGVTLGTRAQLLGDNVRLLGFVEDLQPIYDAARVAALPRLLGGGVAMKVLAAMREGLPVVTTTRGARGLAVRAGEHALVADDPGDFAHAILEAVSRRDLRVRLVAAAHALLIGGHSRDGLRRALWSEMKGLLPLPGPA